MIAFLVVRYRKKGECTNEVADMGKILPWFHIVFLVFFILEIAIIFGNFAGSIVGQICGWIQLIIFTIYVILWIMSQVYLYERNNDCKQGKAVIKDRLETNV